MLILHITPQNRPCSLNVYIYQSEEQVQWLVFKRRSMFIAFVMEMVEMDLSYRIHVKESSLFKLDNCLTSFCRVSFPQC